MQLRPDDPRLIAYLLGELDAVQAAAVERAVAADPALQQALRDWDRVQQTLVDALAPGPASLSPRQRETVRRAARAPLAPALVASGVIERPVTRQRRGLLMAGTVLAAAAAVVMAWVAIARHQPAPVAAPVAIQPTPEPPAPPAPPTAEPTTETRAHLAESAKPDQPADLPMNPPPAPPVIAPAGLVAVTDATTVNLPMQTGGTSFEQIRDAVQNDGQLPARELVHVDQLLNRFELRPNGLTVVARHPATPWHPDDRQLGSTSHAATLATEVLACPWQPSACLVLVAFRANPFGACDIRARYQSNPNSVLRFRLLGATPASEPAPAAPTRLTAGATTVMAIEIEPATASTQLGTIVWSVNDQPAASIPLTRQPAREPSDDARFAALICTFAQWLEGSPAIDPAMLAALARETSSTTMPAARADAITLITEALELAPPPP